MLTAQVIRPVLFGSISQIALGDTVQMHCFFRLPHRAGLEGEEREAAPEEPVMVINRDEAQFVVLE